VPDIEELNEVLKRIDGRSYPAYKALRGRWELDAISLFIDHVQGDPFAAPSKVRLRCQTDLEPAICSDPIQRRAAEDWLLRRFGAALRGQRRGSGRSGELGVYRPGPEITDRSALRLTADQMVEVRFELGLPARGRRVLGREAVALLVDDTQRAAECLKSGPGLAEHVRSVVDQCALRSALDDRGLVAFVANGSVLPRQSGVSQAPLPDAVRFVSPPSLEHTLPTPSGPVIGMGIPEGVTLIVGGGFHGKSTLLQAIQRGHLDHTPGDGREGVVARPWTTKVRAEDGRPVSGVDISTFLGPLPGGKSTAPFDTQDASGSTSQAAAILEAIEAGADVLLLDEDTSASNLLVRDARMRRLIPRKREPITPLVERVQQLHQTWGVSTLLVVGGVGDYLAVADTVIAMNDYLPSDVGPEAAAIAGAVPAPPGPLSRPLTRRPERTGLDPGRVRARDERRIDYGGSEIDLMAMEQVLDGAHASTLGHALGVLHAHIVDGQRTLPECLDSLERLLEADGVEALSPRDHPDGRLVRPRRIEVAAALNRLRSLSLSER
jgi:predicted ABC-class ATPase